MDTKSTPTKEEILPDTSSNEIMQKLEQTAPEWFLEAFAYLAKELNTMNTETKVVVKVKEDLEGQIKIFESKVARLENSISQQETVKLLNEKVTNLENYSCRDNLVVEGTPESPNEDIQLKILAFFKDKLGVENGDDIVLSRVHRLGKPPHIVAEKV